MRYWTVDDATYSEDEILGVYWDFWYDRMCKAFGKDYVDKNYSRQDCIQDWVAVNWAVPGEEFFE